MTASDTQGGSVLARVLHEREISRRSFLKGGGALVIGLSVVGVPGQARAANNPNATSPRHLGGTPGPTDPTQIDSYLEVNPDLADDLEIDYPGFSRWAQAPARV